MDLRFPGVLSGDSKVGLGLLECYLESQRNGGH